MQTTPARSATGHHFLLPASESPQVKLLEFPRVPTRSFISWSFARGAIIWRIWPAVLLHTAFAAAVVTMSMRTEYKLGIPNVLLTLLGVVIGFVISYRAMSGYDRYWQGRTSWSDVIRTSRTFVRLVWFHVPLSFEAPGASSPADGSTQQHREKERERTVHRAMAEKRMALDLILAFSVALKHHLRGEMGIYYEDLYPLVKALHEHQLGQASQIPNGNSHSEPVSSQSASPDALNTVQNPVVPPINSYGTITGLSSQHQLAHQTSSSSLTSDMSTDSSRSDETQPLLPTHVLLKRRRKGLVESVSKDLIPFNGVFSALGRIFSSKATHTDNPFANDVGAHGTHVKHRPRVAGGGENVPLDVVRALSCWLSVLEARGSVYGSTLGAMFGCLSAFEDSLAALEKILTTPLPFVFSVHISTVWLYLFALPFQLVDQFGWHTIPGVGVAAFIYLGFIATGEEIEQPFGYDENDLDLDLFCHELIRADIEHVKSTQWKNVWLGPPHPIPSVSEDNLTGKHGRIEELFGQQVTSP